MKSNLNTNLNYMDEWKVSEESFNEAWLGKYEAIMAQGNGYLGVRAATEEAYVGETRNTFVTGTFDAFPEEVTELPNLPDVLGMEFFVNDERLDLSSGITRDYQRRIDYQTGELVRNFIWETATHGAVSFEFRRCVSQTSLHFIKQQVKVVALEQPVEITIVSGIDGRVSNSGSQHFIEIEKRKKAEMLQMSVRTMESKVNMTVSTQHQVFLDGKEFEVKKTPQILRRQILETFQVKLVPNQVLGLEKTSSIFTGRDFDYQMNESVEMRATNEMLKATDNYQQFFEKSKQEWQVIYNQAQLKIKSQNKMDQLLLNFSRYHLHIMTHPQDNRVNIGAKGLTGEGYKGHTFWDTDIFILPYFTFCYPEIAENLVDYRYQLLAGAREKARKNGYLGAQIPWESAWLDDGETTPRYGDVDIVTGKPTLILTGLIEDHVSSDVVYGFKRFLDISGRKAKTREFTQLVLETALFWTTRAEKNKQGQYEINDVIGPDEYKEHVNNNTYTNRMAQYNVNLALEVLSTIDQTDFESIRQYLNNLTKAELKDRFIDFSENIFIHQVNREGILPQDDTYLTKANLDIQGYKDSPKVNEIFKEYNLTQVNEYQVSKQADVLLLLTNFFDDYNKQMVEANFAYYEKRTLHDSSLSLSTHSLLASLLGKNELAYEFFQKLITIDLGKNMSSSNHGIHSASMGGVWQSVVLGFGGLRFDSSQQRLCIDPNLPKEWDELTYQIFFKGAKLEVKVTLQTVSVKNLSNHQTKIEYYHQGRQHFTE